jgi:type II secretion system protein C
MLSKIFSIILATTTSALMLKAEELVVAASDTIGISIIGTIVQQDHTKNVVLVKELVSGKVQAYRSGHAIMEKFRIIEIENQFIVVLKENKKTKVFQDKFAGSGAAIAGNGGKGASDNYSEDGFERKGGKVAMTAMYRDKIVKEDMAKIMMQVTAQPYMRNGQIKGFQLSQLDVGSIFEKGGFHENDIITAINGIQLDSAAGAIKLLNSLKEATSIDVIIERDGAEQDMNLSIN